MLEMNYPGILQWNHYELWNRSGKLFTPEDWKQFRLNDKVDEWYDRHFWKDVDVSPKAATDKTL